MASKRISGDGVYVSGDGKISMESSLVPELKTAAKIKSKEKKVMEALSTVQEKYPDFAGLVMLYPKRMFEKSILREEEVTAPQTFLVWDSKKPQTNFLDPKIQQDIFTMLSKPLHLNPTLRASGGIDKTLVEKTGKIFDAAGKKAVYAVL
ncbi:MAG: hypothetical protein GF334_02245 [Candidatus Altiarchaeales archaeon]|nr:hypothetical protein [Candidatus Altiarchaeales archaeon]